MSAGFLVLATVAASDTSATLAPLSSASEPSSIATLASMVGGLIVVLVVIFVLAWLVRRLNLVPGQHGLMKTIAITPLGHKEKVVIMELEGQQYLLGVTAQQITLLDKLATPVAASQISFADRLKQVKQTAQREEHIS
ncbi:flagellar biosynthetic protein FliO [Shewanella sp. NIFS-20-20]|uniref:flagellar biosynthetic protein FliO n=1 Tax=Shewanella sp. NIFS-20-20 TaxID=2853806 RepID=UPI001C47FEBB|nr:flagellar biosynthetic protein FliO [Shewanella sp. NIFS-20-20]MBV7314801.1 flagellar biosynthetic protein FliO [Shewanella sp. NIFS-20-20]